MILVNQFLSALVQLLVLTAVPFVWYLAVERRPSGFFRWVGLHRASSAPAGTMALIALGFAAVTLLPYWYLYRTGSLTYSRFAADSFRLGGWSAETVLVILLWAVVQTSLSEEIFFRGSSASGFPLNGAGGPGRSYRRRSLVRFTSRLCGGRDCFRQLPSQR